MSRSRRHAIALIASGVLALAACGGDDSGSSGSGSAGSDSSGAGSSVEQTDGSAGGSGGVLTDVALIAAVTALPDIAYSCTPEEYSATSALRSLCAGFSSVFLKTHAWSDAASVDQEIASEIYCTASSPMGEYRFLRGDTWAVSATPTNGSSAEYADEIDAILGGLQATLGGEQSSFPCG